MGVLAAVLADAGRIALDVAGIERRLVERRREQQRQPVAAMHQQPVERGHRLDGARRIGRRPRSRPRIGRWNRCGIPRWSPSPAACRRRSSRGDTTRRPSPRGRARARSASACAVQAAARAVSPRAAAIGTNARQGGVQEPAQPDALALARLADAVHAVVPVAGADQRQAVRAGGEAEVEAARAMLEQRRRLVGLVGLEVEIVLAGPQRAAPSRNGTRSSRIEASPVVST